MKPIFLPTHSLKGWISLPDGLQICHLLKSWTSKATHPQKSLQCVFGEQALWSWSRSCRWFMLTCLRSASLTCPTFSSVFDPSSLSSTTLLSVKNLYCVSFISDQFCFPLQHSKNPYDQTQSVDHVWNHPVQVSGNHFCQCGLWCVFIIIMSIRSLIIKKSL